MRSNIHVYRRVFARSRIKVTVGNAHFFSDVCADPVGDIFLVHRIRHRIIICVISARSWEIKSYRFSHCSNSVGKLRLFTWVGVWICWVSEIKITCELIMVRSWCHQVCRCKILSLRFSDNCANMRILSLFRTVCFRSHFFLYGRHFLPKLVLLRFWRWFADFKILNLIRWLKIVVSRSWITVISQKFCFNRTSKYGLLIPRIELREIMSSRPRVNVLQHIRKSCILGPLRKGKSSL